MVLELGSQQGLLLLLLLLLRRCWDRKCIIKPKNACEKFTTLPTPSLKGFQLWLHIRLPPALAPAPGLLLHIHPVHPDTSMRKLTGSSGYNNIQHRLPALNTSRHMEEEGEGKLHVGVKAGYPGQAMRRVNVCAIKLKSVYASIVEAVERGQGRCTRDWKLRETLLKLKLL